MERVIQVKCSNNDQTQPTSPKGEGALTIMDQNMNKSKKQVLKTRALSSNGQNHNKPSSKFRMPIYPLIRVVQMVNK